jgi:PAS domain S-box-containing protein
MDAADRQVIRQLLDDYLRMYASRDDRLTAHFSEDFSGFTGGGDFLVKDRKEWVAITRQDFAQVKEPIRIELKDLALQSLADTIAVATSFFTIHLPIKDHVLSRETARLVLIFRKEAAGWKIAHSSISIPYYLVREGEVYPMKELVDRNQLLGELIAERTTQLSEVNDSLQQTNRELAREIAERAQAEQALRASEQRYRGLFESSHDAVFVHDAAGRLLDVNPRACELLGYRRNELLALSLPDLHPAEERAAAEDAVRRLQATGAVRFESTFQRADGARVEVEISARRVAADLATYQSIARDTTDRRQLEAERLIRSKLEATGILAGGIAHDFNNLLAVILGNVELAELPGNDAAAALAAARQATLSAHELTQQFLTFAQGGAPVRHLTPLPNLLRGAATEALRGSPVTCEFAISEDLWPVLGDPGQLGQVIRNLVLNARDAMPTGGRVAVCAENLSGPAPIVRLTVADRGSGIAADVLPRIFDPYFSTKRRGEQRGMGLGLTVARAVVEKHEGTIAVESTPGQGTIIRLTLPAAVSPAPAAPAPLAPAPRPGGGRLLLMDDEPTLRTTTAALLQRLGYSVETASSGEEAVAAYQAARGRGEPFAGVILDLTVQGGMGGVRTLEALRRLCPEIKAIASSGYTDDPVLLDPQRHGFQGALAKPYRLAELRERCAALLGA